jgi:predicted dehydrogenase
MKVVLIGCGAMGIEYAKVLSDLNVSFEVIGRSQANIDKFREIFPSVKVQVGGLEKNHRCLTQFTHAIVATNVTSLTGNVVQLLDAGLPDILVEKPGFGTPAEAEQLNVATTGKNSRVVIAYNRRFLASVLKAKDIIQSDGGVLSFNFEFTEWSHVIDKLECPEVEKQFLFLANSTHVVDLAFFLGGHPTEIHCHRSGQLPWHKTGAIFSGSGVTNRKALFSYNANWVSAGRWGVEVLTAYHRLIFRPLEKLQIQKKGSVSIEFAENIDYTLDEKFKPGLYNQLKSFLNGDEKDLCSFADQYASLGIYRQISGY